MNRRPLLVRCAAVASSLSLFALYLAYQAGCMHSAATTSGAAAPPATRSAILIYGSKSGPAFTTHTTPAIVSPLPTIPLPQQQMIMNGAKPNSRLAPSPGGISFVPSPQQQMLMSSSKSGAIFSIVNPGTLTIQSPESPPQPTSITVTQQVLLPTSKVAVMTSPLQSMPQSLSLTPSNIPVPVPTVPLASNIIAPQKVLLSSSKVGIISGPLLFTAAGKSLTVSTPPEPPPPTPIAVVPSQPIVIPQAAPTTQPLNPKP